MKETTQLGSLIIKPEMTNIMETHNGLSAFSTSAAPGVRDNYQAIWQVLDEELLSDAPSLLDGDTGCLMKFMEV